MTRGVLPELALASVSMVEVLRRRADEQGERCACTFLLDGETEAGHLSYAGLDRRARAIAAVLSRHGLRGERVLLLFPPGLAFIEAFLGCLYSGAVAVPAYPPGSPRGLTRLAVILGDAQPRAALGAAALLEKIGQWDEGVGAFAGIRGIALDDILPEGATEWIDPGLRPEDLAFLQYTSGSTSTPKGVMVSHGNLLHNQRLIQQAFRQDEGSVIVGWLPLYHDMGLIGNVLQPLYAGGRCILMSPAAFLQKPQRWLQAITRYRATTSGGPNFAYDLCARKIGPEQSAGLDLGTWRVAFNGAEPVRADTLERFARAFASCGFRREAFYPCYGLAEATLLVATGGGRGAALRPFDAGELAQGRVAEAAGGRPARTLVGCGGAPAEAVRVVIADPEAARPCAAGEVGEIWVAGPGIAAGYWQRPEESVSTFAARLAGGDGPFLRTGDLGFLREGELFVTGRLKDLIIVRGRNHYPQDIELTAERSHAALRPGCGAAFAVDGDGGERLVLVHEVERGVPIDVEAIADAVRARVAEEHEVQVCELILLRAGTIPKTTSGKVRRRACREAYLTGGLATLGRSAATGDAPAGAGTLDQTAFTAIPPEERASALAVHLRERAARVLRVPPDRLTDDRPLSSYGLDSLMAMELSAEIEESFGLSLDLVHLLGGLSLFQIAAELSRRSPAVRSVPPAPAGDAVEQPLSYGQKALWFLHELAPESGAYNLAAALRIDAELEVAALRDAFEALIERHPQLRTSFHVRDGEPLQRLHGRLATWFREDDVTGWEEERLADRLAAEAYCPFDLSAEPLLRVALFRRAPREHVLLLAAHHIVADFWSLAVLLQELGALYGACRRGASCGSSAVLPPLPQGYGDYVAAQTRLLAGDEGERLWTFWRGALGGELPQLDLPTDRPRPPRRTFTGGARSRRLGRELSQQLGALGRERRSTSYMVLLAGFQTLLYRYTRQVDLLVGSPTAGRSVPGFAGVVGYFVNTLVLRADLRSEPSFGALLSRVRRTVLLALDHQGFPFASLAERLQPARDPRGSPFVQVLFSLQQTPSVAAPGLAAIAVGEPGVRLAAGELALQSIALEQRFAAFDLSLEMAEVDGGLAARLTYDADLFDGPTAERLLGHLEVLLAAAVERPELRLADLPLLTAAEECELLVTRNRTETGWPHDLRVHDLVMAAWARTPDAVAVTGGGQTLTYGALAARARRLAEGLRRLGVGPETRVALCLERSPELLVGLLGVLLAGGAYVPLDPLYPQQRLAMMLEDAQPRLLLTDFALAASLPPHAVPVLGLHVVAGEETDGAATLEEGTDAVLPDHPAYVLFTSGSTGRPKGVQVTHRALVNFLSSMAREPGLVGADALLAVTTLSFDIAELELLLPLIVGGRVELALRKEAADPERLADRLASSGATAMQATPATWQLLLDAGRPPAPGLKALCGGEALPRDLAERLLAAGVEVWNLYGPTETTVWSMAHRVGGDAASVHLGRPIANTRVYLLDPGLRPVPVGVPGEVFIAGAGLARGYLGLPAMTAEKFVPDPFATDPGGRLYRTGDLARHRPGGPGAGIDFLGRIDHQIKIRGFRIELGEIETALTAHPAVREAVVTDRRDAAGAGRLVAYLIPAAGEVPPRAEMLAFLRRRLPDFMLPSAFVALDALPLSPAGKVDRRRLPAPPAPAEDGARRDTPCSPAEELLAGIWSDLLGIEAIGRDDDFFVLGGHSLLAARLALRVREAFGCDLTLRSIFEAPTLARLAGTIAAAKDAGGVAGTAGAAPVPRWTGEAAPLSFGQQRLWLSDRLQPESAVYNMPAVLRLAGRLDAAALARALAEVVRRHQVLRTSFPSPQ